MDGSHYAIFNYSNYYLMEKEHGKFLLCHFLSLISATDSFFHVILHHSNLSLCIASVNQFRLLLVPFRIHSTTLTSIYYLRNMDGLHCHLVMGVKQVIVYIYKIYYVSLQLTDNFDHCYVFYSQQAKTERQTGRQTERQTLQNSEQNANAHLLTNYGRYFWYHFVPNILCSSGSIFLKGA